MTEIEAANMGISPSKMKFNQHKTHQKPLCQKKKSDFTCFEQCPYTNWSELATSWGSGTAGRVFSVGCRRLRDLVQRLVGRRMPEFLAILQDQKWPNDEPWTFGSTTFSAKALHDFPSEWPGVVERLVIGLRSEQNVVDSDSFGSTVLVQVFKGSSSPFG